MLESANYVHLKRLFRLRNLAIIGQIIAVIFTQYALDIPLPLQTISFIVLLIILFNGYVWIRLQQHKVITENEIFLHLFLDVFSLFFLLYFTGGATNPFVILFLFPLTITITILPVRYAWFLAAATVVFYSLLMFHYQPLPMGHEMSHTMNQNALDQTDNAEYNLHLVGMWLAFILNACLITYYVYGMGNTLRRQQKELATAKEQSIHDEKLVLLGTLAASTAHELGTPLGTMLLLVNEIEQELPTNYELVMSDLTNLKTQINRCKTSLSDLSASIDVTSDLLDGKSQATCLYFEEVIAEVRGNHTSAVIHLECDSIIPSVLYSDRTLSLSLINIIENAIEVSPEFVAIKINIIDDSAKITIIDQGSGLTEEALDKIGQQPYSDKELGLGLGLYLAHAAIRRRQGSIIQENNETTGSKTTIYLPLIKN